MQAIKLEEAKLNLSRLVEQVLEPEEEELR